MMYYATRSNIQATFSVTGWWADCLRVVEMRTSWVIAEGWCSGGGLRGFEGWGRVEGMMVH